MTKLKLHVTPQLVKKVKANADFSKASGPICIPLEVLRKPELFNMRLKESCFQTVGRYGSSYLIYGSCVGENVGERPMAKNDWPVILLSVVSSIL